MSAYIVAAGLTVTITGYAFIRLVYKRHVEQRARLTPGATPQPPQIPTYPETDYAPSIPSSTTPGAQEVVGLAPPPQLSPLHSSSCSTSASANCPTAVDGTDSSGRSVLDPSRATQNEGLANISFSVSGATRTAASSDGPLTSQRTQSSNDTALVLTPAPSSLSFSSAPTTTGGVIPVTAAAGRSHLATSLNQDQAIQTISNRSLPPFSSPLFSNPLDVAVSEAPIVMSDCDDKIPPAIRESPSYSAHTSALLMIGSDFSLAKSPSSEASCSKNSVAIAAQEDRDHAQCHRVSSEGCLSSASSAVERAITPLSEVSPSRPKTVLSRNEAIKGDEASYDETNRGSRIVDASDSTLRPASLLALSAAPSNAAQSNSFFQHAYHVNISGYPIFKNNVTNVHGGGTSALENLRGFVSFDAQFDSSAQDPGRRCHPGTRQNALKRLGDWIVNPNTKERIFWLHGPAGAGKSAIAQTIARSYTRPKIAATFFFFRSDVNRNDGNRLFTTLAYQLVFSMPEIREYIVHSLSDRPDLPRTDAETQFNQLLTRPFHVLREDAKQFAPSVHAITAIIKVYQDLAPVIIIDGVDECIDENLQRLFLRIIGDAVSDDRIPLRFLIVSRREIHIEQTISRFPNSILSIDLAKLDDANRDIRKFLVDEFSRIAVEQALDPTWPGKDIIEQIVYKSSGNFIFASIVIKFVGDPYCFAKTQLDIVLGMKPPRSMSPFAVLDQLYLEILRRVPDQDFLKNYLTLLTARISVPESYGDLYKDDAVLMHVSEEELRANLRRLRSLLQFEARIDVHHKSLLDFLHDSSRSLEYYIGKQGGIKRYLEVFVHSLQRYISTAIEQPDHAPPSTPKFTSSVAQYPHKIGLPITEWQEVIQPLLDLYDKLLHSPSFTSTWALLPYECAFSRPFREFLHAGIHAGIFNHEHKSASVQSIMSVQKRRSAVSSNATDSENVNDNDLDSVLLSLFVHLPETMENWSPSEAVINRMKTVLQFDCVETVMKVWFVSDAQKLADLLDYLINEKNTLNNIHPDAMRKATLLALKIFARVPILPLSVFKYGNCQWDRHVQMNTIMLTQNIFACKILNCYTVPNLEIETMWEWRQSTIPPFVTIIQIALRTAKAIQFLHSVNVFPYDFNSDDVHLDPSLHPKFRSLFWISGVPLDEGWKESFSPEGNIFCFGCLFYEVCFGINAGQSSIVNRWRIVTRRPSTSTMPEYAWQLIQHCCAIDPKDRPTINQVVREMECWDIDFGDQD